MDNDQDTQEQETITPAAEPTIETKFTELNTNYQVLLEKHNELQERFNKYIDKETSSVVASSYPESIQERRENIQKKLKELNKNVRK